VNYPPANVWRQVQLDPPPDAEPALVAVADDLSLPAEWPVERRVEFLHRWQQETK